MIANARTSNVSMFKSGIFLSLIVALLLMVASCVMAPPDHSEPDGDDQPTDDQPVAGASLATYQTEHFVGPSACAACHTDLTDEGGNNVSIDKAWRATPMANAAKDPYFQATVEAEVAAEPALAAVIEDTCSKCHSPLARTQALADGGMAAYLGDGFFNEANGLHTLAMDGVSCTLCHQITSAFQDNAEASFSGGYVIDTSTEAPDRIIYGPFPDPMQPSLMQGAVGYTPTYGTHIGASGLCATCHTLFTPTVDAGGEVVGEFPEQTPFLEWQQSNFGDDAGDDDRTCQSCHMPLADGAVAISKLPNDLTPREVFYQHVFRGGNRFLLAMLRNNIEALGLSASTEDFDDAIAITEDFLQNHTAKVEVSDAGVAGSTLDFDVKITNLCGHKFPTAFPSRRAWLHVTVTDAGGATVFESGAWDADGKIAGDDEDADMTTFEPHYDEITSAAQVQIYQSVMGNTDGEVTHTLLRGHVYLKDNRLLPAGLDKSAATEDTAVNGTAATDDDFVGGSDTVTYSLDVGTAGSPFTVSVELVYQTTSYPFAHDLAEETGTFIDRFNTMFDDADKTPVQIASDETTVQ